MINSLRRELNRERTYVRGYKIRVKRGAPIEPSTPGKVEVKIARIILLAKAIKKLNKIHKPCYYWLKPERN